MPPTWLVLSVAMSTAFLRNGSILLVTYHRDVKLPSGLQHMKPCPWQ